MTSLRRSSATPFLVSVAPRVCRCHMQAKELSVHKLPKAAVRTIEGYWNVYVGFFGDQTMWLDFMVTDTRDGKVIWKNGRLLTEEDYAPTGETGTSPRGTGRNVRLGEWVAGKRNAEW